MKQLIGGLAACLIAIGNQARAQDSIQMLAYGTELKPGLEAGDAQALAFTAGAIGSLYLRGIQGDPQLFWLPRCIAATFMPLDDAVPYIIAAIDDGAEISGDGQYAGYAILSGVATYCAEKTSLTIWNE